MAADPIAPYLRNPLPILAGGHETYTNQELERIALALASTQAMTPQAAVKAPLRAQDGMVRLARNPWRPVAGQTVDKWVYYDAAGAIWRYLATDPTNT